MRKRQKFEALTQVFSEQERGAEKSACEQPVSWGNCPSGKGGHKLNALPEAAHSHSPAFTRGTSAGPDGKETGNC